MLFYGSASCQWFQPKDFFFRLLLLAYSFDHVCIIRSRNFFNPSGVHQSLSLIALRASLALAFGCSSPFNHRTLPFSLKALSFVTSRFNLLVHGSTILLGSTELVFVVLAAEAIEIFSTVEKRVTFPFVQPVNSKNPHMFFKTDSSLLLFLLCPIVLLGIDSQAAIPELYCNSQTCCNSNCNSFRHTSRRWVCTGCYRACALTG